MAVRFGMDDAEALRAVTSYPAEILGIDDRKVRLSAEKMRISLSGVIIHLIFMRKQNMFLLKENRNVKKTKELD